jgi:GT2 family glycosyltransferase
MPLCSIIIPVHNHASLTHQCLQNLFHTPPQIADIEVIVVDDASTDVTRAMLASWGENVRVIRHEANTGFATACNDGAMMAHGDYVVFLNNDTIPLPGWLDALVLYAHSHTNAAMVGSKLLYPNDTVQHAGVVINQDRWPVHVYVGFPAEHPAINKSRRFQAVTAACALIRRDLFETLGGFDTLFRNGYEDVDLCLRLGEEGYESHYCHESVLYHLESVTREGPGESESANERAYASRWRDRVTPDDLQYYVEDGLLSLVYTGYAPLQVRLSPEFGVVLREENETVLERLLDRRSRQVQGLLREHIRLQMRVRELEMRVARPDHVVEHIIEGQYGGSDAA